MIGSKITIASNKLVIATFLLISVFSPLFSTVINPSKVEALSGSEFRAGRIIDDAVFYNSSSMTAEQIQSFLTTRRPSCDTNGDQSIFDPSTNTTVTRKVYSERRGVSTPFICLPSFRQNIPAVTNTSTSLCKGSIASGNKSSAQIIKDVSNACGINPQVLLVLLQKEQSLVTDDWPWPSQYDKAMGYACPDSGPNNSANCDSNFFGFFNQVYNAAQAFRRYEANPNNYNYRANRNNYIQYNPNVACGGSNVFIENQATASLYIYTPYQPNAAALNDLYGSGDLSDPNPPNCSAFGNRNFWRLFNDWFGSPIGCNPTDSSYIYRLFRPSDQNYLYTQNSTEICQATKFYGYTLEGPVFRNDVLATDAGARSVFRLSRNGIYIFTTDPAERDAAMQRYGYRYEGVAYYVSSVSTGRYPVHRLSYNGRYVFTVSEFEKNSFQTFGFNYEGTPYYANSVSEKIPIFRVSKNGFHLYTASRAEKDFAVLMHGFADQGIAFYGLSGQTGDNLMVYRFNRGQSYLNTALASEKYAALGARYFQQTSHFFVYPPNYAGTVPIYRLSNPRNGDYLLTSNTAERDLAIQSYGYRYEGVGFNAAQPD